MEHRNIILSTERGVGYFKSLEAIFGIIRRIFETVSDNFSAYNFDPIFLDELETFGQKWNILLQDYFPNLKIFPKISSHKFLTSINISKDSKACCICLRPPQNTSDEEEVPFIEFVGNLYHTNCANFYLNRVGILLPNLC